MLTGKYSDGMPEGSRGATTDWLKREMTPENLEKIKQLSAVATENGMTMNQLALAWILRRPEISSAITGATKPEHVSSNVEASNKELDKGTLEKIEEHDNFHIAALDSDILRVADKIDVDMEMHDKLIVATSIYFESTLITRDRQIRGTGIVPTIW